MLEIYLTDLQAYNEGNLVGKWITLPLSNFELAQAISEVLAEGESISGSEDHEEYFITDYSWEDNEFFEVGEYENIQELNKKLQAIAEVEPDKHKAIAFLLSEGLATDLDDAIDKADEVHIHESQTMETIAFTLMDELFNTDELPSLIANHIDYEGIGRDLLLGGSYYEIGSDIYEYAS